MDVSEVSATERGPRERVLAATAQLLADGGREAVSTRTVGAAAGVQAPTIYRLFGDMRGLLDAVVAEGFAAYLIDKSARPPVADPVEDLRVGWDLHIDFGLANPALYLIMSEPVRPGAALPPASAAGFGFLTARIHAIAASGRLRVSEEHASHLIQAVGRGTALALIDMPPEHRDLQLSATAREAVIAAITTDTPTSAAPGPVSAAVTLRAVLPQTTALTGLEQALLREWLDRIAAAGQDSTGPGPLG